MKWVLIFLICSLNARSQDKYYGDWYHISTNRLVHFMLEKKVISWEDETFSFQEKEGKQGTDNIIKIITKGNIVCVIHKDTSGERLGYSTTVLQYSKDGNYIDLLMNCMDGQYIDTIKLSSFFAGCDTLSAFRMRMYSRKTIENYRTLKTVDRMTKAELKKVNDLFTQKEEAMVKEFGEDKLLWVAPVLFQQILTEILLDMGYNPMISEKQADELFSFHYY